MYINTPFLATASPEYIMKSYWSPTILFASTFFNTPFFVYIFIIIFLYYHFKNPA